MPSNLEPILGAELSRKIVTSAQHEQLVHASARMLNRYYGYATLLLMNAKIEFTDQVPTACVMFRNGQYIYQFNPVYFTTNGKTEDHFVFALAHEALHRALQHVYLQRLYSGVDGNTRGVPVPPSVLVSLPSKTRKDIFSDGGQDYLPFDDTGFMVAMDRMVNTLLVRDKIGTLHADWIQTDGVDLAEHTEEILYALHYHNDSKNSGGECHNGPQDIIIIEEGSPMPDDVAKNEGAAVAARVQGMSQIIEGQKLVGHAPASLVRALEALNEAQITWVDKLQRSLIGGMRGHDDTTFNHIDRRFAAVTGLIIPTTVGFQSDTIIIGLDTSGSVSQAEMSTFMTEIAGIIHQMRPRTVIVLPCDALVHDAVYLEQEDVGDFDAVCTSVLDQLSERVTGGGGTSFAPPFQWVEDNHDGPVEAFVYLTDGCGHPPQTAPDYPVYWVTTHATDFTDWGEVIKAEF